MTKNTENPNEAMKVLATEIRAKVDELNMLIAEANKIKLTVEARQWQKANEDINALVTVNCYKEVKTYC